MTQPTHPRRAPACRPTAWHLLSLGASAALLAAAATSAQAQIQISGTLDLALRQVSNGRLGHQQGLVSGSNSTSKLVLRGNEDLGSGLSASFFLDSSLQADTGAVSAPFWDRRSTVSLAHRQYGELRLGRDWVPTHLAWSGIDPFLTLGVASANTFRTPFQSRAMNQAFGTTAEAVAQNPTLRVNNTLQLFLPAGLGGVYGAVMVSAGEGGQAAAGATRGQGGRLGWSDGKANIGLAVFDSRNANGGRTFSDQVIAASYNFGPVLARVGQRSFKHGTDRTTMTLLAATVPTAQGAFKLSWVRADQQGATAALSANDATLLGLGYQHNLSKRSAMYAQVAQVSNRGAAAFTVPGGPATSGVATASNYFGGQTSRGYELGLRHDF